jgi:hypothetical protein
MEMAELVVAELVVAELVVAELVAYGNVDGNVEGNGMDKN